MSEPWLSRSFAQHQRRGGEPDRDVDPEDPLPVDPLDHGAADQRPERDGDPGDRAEHADRGAALAPAGTPALSSAKPSGRTSAAPAPWIARAAISTPDARRQRAGRRGEREQDQAGRVHAPAPEPVAERRAGDQQHGEAQVVGVHGPLELLDGRRRGRARIVLSAEATTSVSSAAITEPIAVRPTVQRAGRGIGHRSITSFGGGLSAIARLDAEPAANSPMSFGARRRLKGCMAVRSRPIDAPAPTSAAARRSPRPATSAPSASWSSPTAGRSRCTPTGCSARPTTPRTWSRRR